MAIIDKLKTLDQTKITSQTIIDAINEAITLDGQELTAVEQAAFEKLYDKATLHIKDTEEKAARKAEKDAEDERKRIEKEESDKRKESEHAEKERVKAEQEAKKAEEEENKIKLQNMIETLAIPHLEYAKSQNKTITTYPKEIKSKHNGWNMLYKKLLKRSKNFKVDTTGVEVSVGQDVKIVETKPMSREKHFKIFVYICQ